MARSLVETMNKKNKGANVKPFMVKQYLSVFINCMIENPAFESQVRPQACHDRVLNVCQLPACFASLCKVVMAMHMRICLMAYTRIPWLDSKADL